MLISEIQGGFIAGVEGGYIAIRVYAPNIVRVTFTKGLGGERQSQVVVAGPMRSGYTVDKGDRVVRLSTSEVEVSLDLDSGLVSMRGSEALIGEVSRRVYEAGSGAKGMWSFEQVLKISGDEHIFGSGQHAGYSAHVGLGLRGRTVYLVQRNTDIAIPFIVSSKGYGILWDIYSMGAISVKGDRLAVWFEMSDALDFYFIEGPEVDRIISSYRRLTGSAPIPPKWAFGYWQSKERYASQSEMISVAREFRRRGIPIDVLVLDWKYWGKYGWNAFKFDEADFPDPEAMVKELHSLGIRVAVSIWPIFGRETEIYREMEAAGCLFKGTGLLNIFKSECGELFWRKIEEVFFKKGFDAWWLDASEPEVEPRPIYSTWQHDLFPDKINIYPLLETQAVYRGQRRVSDKRVVILTRSAFAGQQRNSAINWSGDVTGDWTTFVSQIWGGLSLAVSGIPYWTTDIGGFFSGNPDTEGYRELFVRWFQFGAFCPIFRVHGTYYAKEPWRFGSDVEKILVDFIKLRYRLLPYIYSLAWLVYREGYTIMRPLVMDFRKDPEALEVDDQFMFGPSIMVSPVTRPSARERDVYLPRGIWYDFWTGEQVVGGRWVTASAPLERIPLHVRAGAIIPLAPVKESAGGRLEELELRIYPGSSGSFLLYEDDGESYGYERGEYTVIPIKWYEEDQELVIGDKEGDYKIGEVRLNIVWVGKGEGVGIGVSKPHAVEIYRGREIRVRRPSTP